MWCQCNRRQMERLRLFMICVAVLLTAFGAISRLQCFCRWPWRKICWCFLKSPLWNIPRASLFPNKNRIIHHKASLLMLLVIRTSRNDGPFTSGKFIIHQTALCFKTTRSLHEFYANNYHCSFRDCCHFSVEKLQKCKYIFICWKGVRFQYDSNISRLLKTSNDCSFLGFAVSCNLKRPHIP